ncbi:MAG: anti-sigma factor [Balneolaceae bacterium]|nr:anti-sigma factor [Balneolaceae bacterium]
MTTDDKHDLFLELCTAHVLGALSPEDEVKLQELLDEVTEEQKECLYDMQAIAAEMAVLSPEKTPSPGVKHRIIEMANATAATPKQPADVKTLSKLKYAIAASFIFIFLSIGLLFYSQSLQSDLQQKTEVITQQENTIHRLETEVERREELLSILEAREVDLIMMDGLEVNPAGYGKVVWDKESGQALLQVANLPPVPTQKDYQLWFVVDNQPISAGVFAVNNPEQDNFFKIEEFRNQAPSGAFAITLEPEGGSPQPTGDMYLLGNMQ